MSPNRDRQGLKTIRRSTATEQGLRGTSTGANGNNKKANEKPALSRAPVELLIRPVKSGFAG